MSEAVRATEDVVVSRHAWDATRAVAELRQVLGQELESGRKPIDCISESDRAGLIALLKRALADLPAVDPYSEMLAEAEEAAGPERLTDEGCEEMEAEVADAIIALASTLGHCVGYAQGHGGYRNSPRTWNACGDALGAFVAGREGALQEMEEATEAPRPESETFAAVAKWIAQIRAAAAGVQPLADLLAAEVK